MRFSRDLLTRGISYKLQERAYGGLSTATARKLERASAGPLSRGAVKPAPSVSLRPGTRLVREWRGVTHTVLIHADGIEWRGQRYRSLSVVAREITGARWSGPRFFGLRRRQLDLRERAMARADHVRAGLTIRCAVYTRAPRLSRCGLAPRRAHAAWMYSSTATRVLRSARRWRPSKPSSTSSAPWPRTTPISSPT